MFIIGTAGHIDHGKSSIVRRLTGTDPDRLPEEQSRGMTIDLGFAFLTTASGQEIGFIDVPGHERFVRNMIAGAGGIDAVMLVIAADDGWMPQSQEHFQIVRLLGVRNGIIVINKCDLAEKDWLDLLEIEIREKCAGSFLESASTIRVSAENGAGFDELNRAIVDIVAHVDGDRDIGTARLYIDRSFHRPGMGGVVTGTLRDGSLRLGQTVTVWPGMKQAKVRTMQSRGKSIEMARPGQRTAVSFTGIEKSDLMRGGAITGRRDLSYFRDHSILSLSLELLKESPVAVNNRRRLLLIVGTIEVTGEVRVYDTDAIQPGSDGIVFFIPDEPVFALAGDHFVVRLPTPMVTIGGGRILDHLSRVPRRKDYGACKYLTTRVNWQVEDVIVSELQKLGVERRDALLTEAAFSRAKLEASLDQLLAGDDIGQLGAYVYHRDRLRALADVLYRKLFDRLKESSHVRGLTAEELYGLSEYPRWQIDLIIRVLIDEGRIVIDGEVIKLAGHQVSLSGEVKKAYEEIVRMLRADPYAPPALPALSKKGKAYRDAIGYILTTGEGYKCGTEFVFLMSVWNEIVNFVKNRLDETQRLAVADLRNEFGFSRKFVIPILEETDRIGFTRREGDIRVKGERLDK